MQKEQRKREKRREKKRKMRERRKLKMDILDNDMTRPSFSLDFSVLYCNYGLCFSTPINRKSFIFTDAKGDLKCWRFSDEEKVEIPNDD